LTITVENPRFPVENPQFRPSHYVKKISKKATLYPKQGVCGKVTANIRGIITLQSKNVYCGMLVALLCKQRLNVMLFMGKGGDWRKTTSLIQLLTIIT
jgi:hypothetical protein